MAALTDLSDIVNRATGGNSGTPQNKFWFKDGRVDAAAASAPIAGRWVSLWMYEGVPAGGPTPTTVRAPDNTTDGSLKQASPGGGRQQWILGSFGATSQAGTLLIYDRLLDIGGLSGTTTTAQTVGGSITRNTGGEGNQIWVEINTIIGTTATTITASYTNQAGTSGRTTIATAFGGTGLREAQRMIPLPLQQGDTGVQSVQSVTVLASTTTAGNFGVVILQPLGLQPLVGAGIGCMVDYVSGRPGPIENPSGSCIAAAVLCNTTTALQTFGSIHLVEA